MSSAFRRESHVLTLDPGGREGKGRRGEGRTLIVVVESGDNCKSLNWCQYKTWLQLKTLMILVFWDILEITKKTCKSTADDPPRRTLYRWYIFKLECTHAEHNDSTQFTVKTVVYTTYEEITTKKKNQITDNMIRNSFPTQSILVYIILFRFIPPMFCETNSIFLDTPHIQSVMDVNHVINIGGLHYKVNWIEDNIYLRSFQESEIQFIHVLLGQFWI